MRTLIDGPLIVYGDSNPVQAMNPDKGPSLIYQGLGIPDPRFLGTIQGVQTGIYPVPAYGYGARILALDITPTLGTTTQIAAAAAVTSGTAMTLATTVSTGRVPNVPIVPYGSAWTAANVVTTKLALDMGFLTCNTTAGSPTISNLAAGSARYFFAGQKLILGEGGGTGVPQIVTVLTTPAITATTLTLVENVVASKTGTALAFAHPSGLGAFPYASGRNGGGGPTFLMNPGGMTARVVSITSPDAGATGGAFTVRGYDIYGQAMTETITHAGAATTAYGLKAWKYITSVTPGFTDTATYSVGTGDVFGLPFRSDFFEDVQLTWIAAWQTANTGWLPAVLTAASATTGDVRGTIQLGTGGGGTGYTTSPNASRRLRVFQEIPPWMQAGATYLNPEHMFGNIQA